MAILMLGDKSLNKVMCAAHNVFAEVVETGKRDFLTHDEDWSNRSCCMFGIYRIMDNEAACERQAMLGSRGSRGSNHANIKRYVQYMAEKAKRLAKSYSEEGHVSSYQSRDPDNDQYGGAVIIKFPDAESDYIISVSGLPEKADEALALLAAIHSEQVENVVVNYGTILAEKSQNEYWKPFLKAVLGIELADEKAQRA